MVEACYCRPICLGVRSKPRGAATSRACWLDQRKCLHRTRSSVWVRAAFGVFRLNGKRFDCGMVNVRADASDGGEDSEDENPFAALLQHRTSPPPDSEDQRESGGRDEVEVEISQVVEVSTVKSTQGDSREQSARSALRRPRKLAKATSSDSQKSTKRLSFESATSRPARWGSSQSSVKDATNRRKALTSLRQQREQGGPR